jgi:glycine cleavage system aminomethyltransferase T
VSFEFLAPDAAAAEGSFTPVARSLMERDARKAGARFETRHGWNVAVGYKTPEQEQQVLRETAGWADLSHLGKIEIQASPEDLAAIVGRVTGGGTLELGRALRAADAWWLPYTRDRALVLSDLGATPALRDRIEEAAAATAGFTSVVELTSGLGAMAIAGPLAREVIARFSAVDLRPSVTQPQDFNPVSVARTPGAVLVEDTDRYVLLFGSAHGSYLWEVVADAGQRLGATPVGVDALAALPVSYQEAAHA